MKERIEKAINNSVKTLRKIGTIIAVTLLLANVAYAAVPISDGFDYPVGIPDGEGWYVAQDFQDTVNNLTGLQGMHLGEDWNKVGGDEGEPEYAIGNGEVIRVDYVPDPYPANPNKGGWGRVVLIKHKLLPGSDYDYVVSSYGHFGIDTNNPNYVNIVVGDKVRRGQKIGYVGAESENGGWSPHLHFEVRTPQAINDPDCGLDSCLNDGYDLNPIGWLNPTSVTSTGNIVTPGFVDQHRPQTSPLIGDWDGNGIDSTGTFNPRTSVFSLKNETDDEIVNQQFGEPGDIPIVGDWDGDGKNTIGIYRPKTAEFHLDNNNDGARDYDPINFGNIGDYPIVGDWNKDGQDEVGVFRSIDPITLKTTFFLKYPDKVDTVEFGIQTDMPIIGDWNNDGQDDVGVFRRYDPDHGENAVFYLKNGDEIINVIYGNNDDIPIVGKPKVDKLTRIGVYRPSIEEFIFKLEPVFQPSGVIDIVIAIDTTGSMGPYINAAKASASEIVEALDSTGLNYRVSIVNYEDFPQLPYGGAGDYPYNLNLPFSSDKDEIVNSINGLSLGWGADWRESVYSALVLSMTDINKDTTRADNYGWRYGATKVIIIMGDAPPHVPIEPWAGGYSLDDVIYWSQNIDPVEVYSIVVGHDSTTYAAFSEISEGTNGKIYSSPTADDVVDAILEAIGDIGGEQGVYVSISPADDETNPGGSVAYSVDVTNTGDINDIYGISLDLENFLIPYRAYPTAIQYSWVTFDDSNVELDPSMSEIRPLTVTVPENWAGMENTTYTFSVTATSTTDESISNTSFAELEVKANKRSMVEYSKLEVQWLSELVEISDIDQEIKIALLDKLTNASLKLDQAITNIDNGKIKTADNMLVTSQNIMSALVYQTDAQDGKKITQPSAEDLREKTSQIIGDIEEAKEK